MPARAVSPTTLPTIKASTQLKSCWNKPLKIKGAVKDSKIMAALLALVFFCIDVSP